MKVKMVQTPMDVTDTNLSIPISIHDKVEEIREEPVQTEIQKGTEQSRLEVICDNCFSLNLGKIAALLICYTCKKYLCGKCYEDHKSHCMIKAVSERREAETSRRGFLGEIRNEREREYKFKRDNFTINDKVNVKHTLDKRDCGITVVCGLHNTMWLVSDNNNSCIKIFSLGSNILQRYIRFGSEPFGVTEINVKRELTEQDITPKTESSYVSVSNRTKPYTQFMLAVTLPWVYRIVFIDITQNPAVNMKSIKTKKRCRSIDFYEDTIFTLCSSGDSDNDSHWFVSMLSTDGVTLKIINTEVHTGYIHYLAVCHDKLFVTDWINHKVLCLNYMGNVLCENKTDGSGPSGVSVDPETKKVYICASGHHKLYRRDYSLESPQTILDLKPLNLLRPRALCFHRDKVYVSNCWESENKNFVTVVRVL